MGDLPRVLVVLGLLGMTLGFALRCGRAATLATGAPGAPGGSGLAATAAQPTVTALSVPDLSPSRPLPSPWAEDPVWQRAQAGDPLDLARLAAREGAAGLLEAFEAGGQAALVALLALPSATDAELVLGRLCAVAERVPAAVTAPLLRSIRDILAATPRQRERLDGAGRARCGPALSQLAARADLPPEARDLAASAEAALNDEQHDHR